MPTPEHQRWTEDRVPREHEAWFAQRCFEKWPPYSAFVRDRRKRLHAALMRHDGPQHWAQELGVRFIARPPRTPPRPDRDPRQPAPESSLTALQVLSIRALATRARPTRPRRPDQTHRRHPTLGTRARRPRPPTRQMDRRAHRDRTSPAVRRQEHVADHGRVRRRRPSPGCSRLCAASTGAPGPAPRTNPTATATRGPAHNQPLTLGTVPSSTQSKGTWTGRRVVPGTPRCTAADSVHVADSYAPQASSAVRQKRPVSGASWVRRAVAPTGPATR
jgi:hypothetical protein